MLTEEVIRLYKRFRLLNYREMFGRIREKDGSLSATEAFAADVIYLLEKPTITQLAETLGISQPSATSMCPSASTAITTPAMPLSARRWQSWGKNTPPRNWPFLKKCSALWATPWTDVHIWFTNHRYSRFVS